MRVETKVWPAMVHDVSPFTNYTNKVTSPKTVAIHDLIYFGGLDYGKYTFHAWALNLIVQSYKSNNIFLTKVYIFSKFLNFVAMKAP